MKPISVEMSAFGPYKDSVVIDFSKIGENGIFLITGDTGAGKTTIFDAIVFALYGSVSGSNRQVTTVRSDFADENTQTYVELVFSHKGKIYKVRRNPQYERPKKSGEGTTTQLADAFIEQDGKVLATGIVNVDNKVKEILSIDVKQFKQISMLAQGEFLKILFAESKERTEIFRKIFDTYIYEDIKNKLNDKQKEAYTKLNNYKTKFLTNTNNIKWNEEPDFIKALSEKNIHTYIKDILALLEIEVEKNEEENKEIEKDVKKLDKEQKEKELKIKNSEEINSNFIKLEELVKTEKELKEEKKEFEEKQKIVDQTVKIQALVFPKKELLEKVISEIKIIKQEDQENEEYLKELNEVESEYKEKDKKVKELKKYADEYKKIELDVEKYKEEIENIENVETKFVAIERDNVNLAILKQREEKILKLKDILKEYEVLNEKNEETKEELKKALEVENQIKEREILSKAFDVKNTEYRLAEDKYKEEENKFYREQAGVLADKLEEGKPCPVCGSTHHPELAKKSNALSKEELEKLKVDLEIIEKEKNKANEKLTIKSAQIDTLNKDLKYDNSKVTLIDYINGIKETSEKEEKLIEEKFEEANKLHLNITEQRLKINEFDYDEFKTEFDQKLKNVEENLTKNTTLVDNFKKSMKKEFSAKTEIKEYAKDVKENFEKINENFSKIEEKICDLYYEIEDIYVDIEDFNFEEFKEKYEEEKQKHSKKLIECNTKKLNFSKQLESKQKENEKAQKDYDEAYKKLGFETEKEYKDAILDEDEIEEAKEDIENYNKACIETNTKIKELREVLKDKEKIYLEKDKEELQNLTIDLAKKKEQYIYINSKFTMNKQVLENLSSDAEEVKKQIDLYTILEELYRTASGTLSGKKKIEFEQYVQAAYFDMILVEANKRLVKMTSSRFELVRKENAVKLSDKIGLDLEVIDNYTGKRRDVKSLSGGESFKAALSLSLGVSDVIQSYSGGVVVDTLFIDEGFGSLDVESREQAINTLNMLTDNNKLIGIISHVTELKERIDKKIIIRKTAEGSKVSFE